MEQIESVPEGLYNPHARINRSVSHVDGSYMYTERVKYILPQNKLFYYNDIYLRGTRSSGL